MANAKQSSKQDVVQDNTHKVVFVKRLEDRDQNGKKQVIAAGATMEMTSSEIAKFGDSVRVIRPDNEDGRPVLASGAAPDASGNAGDEDDA
jgi:hypothetical protein